MEVQLINDNLLSVLHWKAKENERLRQNYDLRTTTEDGSQRMLNVLEPGTHVAIHRHLKTSETAICIEGCLEWIFYEELPGVDTGGPVHDGGTGCGRNGLRGGGAIPSVPPRTALRHTGAERGVALNRGS